MKNKKLTYILLPLSILIWAFVIFQFFEKKEAPNAPERTFKEVKTVHDSIAFQELVIDYPDPFLKHSIKHVIHNKENRQVKRIKPNVKKEKVLNEIITWPKIEYGGTINNSKALLKINNRLMITAVNDTLMNVIVKQISQDSIFLEFKKKNKSFGKNKF